MREIYATEAVRVNKQSPSKIFCNRIKELQHDFIFLAFPLIITHSMSFEFELLSIIHITSLQVKKLKAKVLLIISWKTSIHTTTCLWSGKTIQKSNPMKVIAD